MPPIPPGERKPTISIRTAVEHLRTTAHPGSDFRTLQTGLRKLYEPFIRIQEMLDELFGADEEIRQIIQSFLDQDPLANWIFAHHFSGTDMGEQINNAVDSIPDQPRGAFVIVQSGIYDITTPIRIQNRNNIWLMGFGPSTQLRPTADFPAATPFMLLDGSTKIVVSDMLFDGVNADDTIGPCMYVDGSTDNPDVDGIIVQRVRLYSYPAQGITVSAGPGRSVGEVTITDNIIQNHSPLNVSGRNAIHVGGEGSKYRINITNNHVHFPSAPAAPLDGNGHGIFAGQGSLETVNISGNTVEFSLGTGILAFGRPFGSEAVTLREINISNNTIRNPRTKGIALFGGQLVGITSNLVRNPGTAGDTDDERAGVYLSHGVTGASTKVAGSLITIAANTIYDTDTTMVDGIRVECDSGFESTGVINANQIAGFSGLDINLIPAAQDKWVIEPSYPITMEVPSDSLSTGDNQTVVFRFQLPAGYKFRLYRALLSVDTAPSGGDFTIDVRRIDVANVDQGTIFNPATLSVASGTDEVSTFSFEDTHYESGERLEFDIDAVNGATRPLLQLYGWLVSA